MARTLYVPLVTLVACASTVPNEAPPIFVPPDRVIDLQVDGKPFALASCAPGAPDGFHGMELRGEDESRIRIVVEVDGTSKVVLFRPRAERGLILNDCSRADIKESGGRRSSVRGRASIRCNADGVRVEGTVMIEQCSS
jgi:hypothetical protein